MARWLYLAAALVGWSGLAIQALVLFEAHGLLDTLWTLYGYFTVWTATGVSIVATRALMPRRKPDDGSLARYLALVAVLLVGIAYSLMLRSQPVRPGLPSLANHLMHDALPVVYALAWLAGRHGALRQRDAWRAMVPPAIYFVYAMARGFATGRYPYWFIDPHALPPGTFASMVAILFAAVFAMASGLAWLDHRIARRSAFAQLSSNSA